MPPPFPSGKEDPQLLAGANGDMGENETAGFDPIFFFHHCNVDRLFWIWQYKHNATQKIEVSSDPKDKGTWGNGQGATPGIPLSQQLHGKTALFPFLNNPGVFPLTLEDVTDLKGRGREYSVGSFDWRGIQPPAKFIDDTVQPTAQTLLVENVPKNSYGGSFIIEAFDKKTKEKLGFFPVLSRAVPGTCKNCALHHVVHGDIPIKRRDSNDIKSTSDIELRIRTRNITYSNEAPLVPVQTIVKLFEKANQ